MKNITIKSNKNGFSILSIILVIVAIIVAIGVYALSGSSSTGSNTGSADIQASAVQNDALALKTRFDELVINGATASQITYKPNNTDQYNMIDSSKGLYAPKPVSKVLQDGATAPVGVWVYAKWAIAGLGSAFAENVIILGGVKTSVCESINNNLYGSKDIPKYGPLNDVGAFVSGATALDPNTAIVVDFSTGGATSGLVWTSGCIAGANNAPDNNVYFKVLKAN